MHEWSVCVCGWGACAYSVFEALQWSARWPFGWCRGGITVTVWQSGPQPSCNGWALSRWTPLLPLFSLLPSSHASPFFPLRLAACGLCFWPTVCEWCSPLSWRWHLYFLFFLCFCRAAVYSASLKNKKGTGACLIPKMCHSNTRWFKNRSMARHSLYSIASLSVTLNYYLFSYIPQSLSCQLNFYSAPTV